MSPRRCWDDLGPGEGRGSQGGGGGQVFPFTAQPGFRLHFYFLPHECSTYSKWNKYELKPERK